MKSLYHVKYDGLWMGGSAVVLADSEEEAIQLVKDDTDTVKFDKVSVRVLTDLSKSVVFINDNGDY